jgi:hypothetical protein
MNEFPFFIVRSRWEIRDPKHRSGWRLLNWWMSEEIAAVWAKANDAELRRVEERRDVDGRYPGAPRSHK